MAFGLHTITNWFKPQSNTRNTSSNTAFAPSKTPAISNVGGYINNTTGMPSASPTSGGLSIGGQDYYGANYLSPVDTSGQPTYSPTGYSTAGGGSASRSGGGGSALQPAAPPPVDLTPYRNDVTGKIQAIQAAYDALSGGVDTMVSDRANTYNQNYQNQQDQLNTGYKNTANQLTGAYGGRGLGDSSYLGNAQDTANQTYQQNLQSILNDRSQTLGQLGQTAASQKAGFSAGRNQYGDLLGQLGNYDQSQLMGLQSSLPGVLGGLQAQRAGLGTNQQFLDQLNQVTPTVNQGTSQLAQQLQQLSASSTPRFAKNAIAQGLIKQAQLSDPNAQSYWQNFWQQQLQGQ